MHIHYYDRFIHLCVCVCVSKQHTPYLFFIFAAAHEATEAGSGPLREESKRKIEQID